jgi:hypothetical protein
METLGQMAEHPLDRFEIGVRAELQDLVVVGNLGVSHDG